MLERLAITAALISLGLGAYVVGTRLHARRVGRTGWPVLNELRPGIPAIIYFWSEDCAPCKLVQKPALDQLQATLGPDGVQVVAINALEHPILADEWGGLSLPTTFIVDRQGQPRRVNSGVARAGQLKQQIAALDRV